MNRGNISFIRKKYFVNNMNNPIVCCNAHGCYFSRIFLSPPNE